MNTKFKLLALASVPLLSGISDGMENNTRWHILVMDRNNQITNYDVTKDGKVIGLNRPKAKYRDIDLLIFQSFIRKIGNCQETQITPTDMPQYNPPIEDLNLSNQEDLNSQNHENSNSPNQNEFNTFNFPLLETSSFDDSFFDDNEFFDF